MKWLRLFCLGLTLVISGCAHSLFGTEKRAVISDPKSPWVRYDRCSSSGQYRFINGITLAVLVGNELNHIDWIFLDGDQVELEFIDLDPKISITTLPGKEKFEFTPAFTIEQEINVKHPIHKIPKGMTTEYDYGKQKLYYGKNIQPFFGSNYFERHGEVKNPRWTSTTVKGKILSGKPKVGYKRDVISYYYMIKDRKNKSEILVEIPPFKLNGHLVETQKLRFFMGNRSNVEKHDAMLCAGGAPRGLKYYFLRFYNR